MGRMIIKEYKYIDIDIKLYLKNMGRMKFVTPRSRREC